MEFRKWGETELWKSLPRLENNFLTIFDTAWVDWIEGWAKPGWQRQRIYKLFIYAMRASVDVWTTVCSCRAAEHSIFSWIYTLSKARVAVHIDCTLHGPVAKKLFLDFFLLHGNIFVGVPIFPVISLLVFFSARKQSFRISGFPLLVKCWIGKKTVWKI